jgi:carbohydrate-selective porin OprB
VRLREGFFLIPNLQYIIHPGGGYMLNEMVPVATKDAAVVGVRAIIRF